MTGRKGVPLWRAVHEFFPAGLDGVAVVALIAVSAEFLGRR